MPVLFKIVSTFSLDRQMVLVECLELDKNFYITKNSRLGDFELELWLTMPRALDQNGIQRENLFGLALKNGQDIPKLKLKVGEVVQLIPGDQIEYLLPWQESISDPDAFLQELQRELVGTHPLFGQPAQAVAVRIDCDDVIFKLADEKYAVVHLTWSGKPENYPNCPYTQIFDHWKDVYEKVILEDHQDYFA
jgi:hypothetical protein